MSTTQDPSSEITPHRTRRHTPVVVVAEDDDDIRAALTATLVEDGFHVHAVADGEMLAEYLEQCRRVDHLPDVVLTDHRMPGYSGVQVIEGMQQLGMDVPVIMLTAFGAEVRALARARGAIAVFDKPFDLDDLRTAVFWAVDWRRAQLCRPRNDVRRPSGGPPAESPPVRTIADIAKRGGLF
jgi:CheY-like chemotaxis protein